MAHDNHPHGGPDGLHRHTAGAEHDPSRLSRLRAYVQAESQGGRPYQACPMERTCKSGIPTRSVVGRSSETGSRHLARRQRTLPSGKIPLLTREQATKHHPEQSSDTMQRVHEAYNYRRFAKVPEPPPGRRITSHEFEMETSWSHFQPEKAWELLTQEQREKRLYDMSKAERALRFLPAQRREYLYQGNSIALRRNELGLKYLEMGDLPRAFRNFAEAIGQDSELALPYNNIGMLYLEIGDLERAEYHFNKALEINEQLDIAYSNRGLVHMEKGEYEDAYHDFGAAILLDPTDPLHQNNMGILFLEVGFVQEALECLARAISLDPENPMYLNNRGIAHREMGNLTEADCDFAQAIALEEKQFESLMKTGIA